MTLQTFGSQLFWELLLPPSISNEYLIYQVPGTSNVLRKYNCEEIIIWDTLDTLQTTVDKIYSDETTSLNVNS